MTAMTIVSLYDRKTLPDEHLMLWLRGRPKVPAEPGIRTNPHWLPVEIAARGTLRQQFDYWLAGFSDTPAPAALPPSVSPSSQGGIIFPGWLDRTPDSIDLIENCGLRRRRDGLPQDRKGSKTWKNPRPRMANGTAGWSRTTDLRSHNPTL